LSLAITAEPTIKADKEIGKDDLRQSRVNSPCTTEDRASQLRHKLGSGGSACQIVENLREGG